MTVVVESAATLIRSPARAMQARRTPSLQLATYLKSIEQQHDGDELNKAQEGDCVLLLEDERARRFRVQPLTGGDWI